MVKDSKICSKGLVSGETCTELALLGWRPLPRNKTPTGSGNCMWWKWSLWRERELSIPQISVPSALPLPTEKEELTAFRRHWWVPPGHWAEKTDSRGKGQRSHFLTFNMWNTLQQTNKTRSHSWALASANIWALCGHTSVPVRKLHLSVSVASGKKEGKVS